ncbi:MAG: NADH-quinone oxidoreductase subunit NuoF [Candidatus Aminicenantes bacterium]|nr:NADH-quinone oxidoreductase subunit NuoF [Candidatus Aminicenantes bacterium]
MEEKIANKYRLHLMLCAGTACVSNKSFKIKEILEEELKKQGLDKEALVVMTGCNGFCAVGPVMTVMPDGIFYHTLTEDMIPHLVEEHFLKGRPVKKLMFTPPREEVVIPKMMDIGFFSRQTLIALRNRGLIDPEVIDEYIARDGYKALAKALSEMTPKEIITEIKNSGLRGRGGAGFPTGLKWELCSKSKGNPKYIICNADEGDPGAYMDRSIVEADPHSVLEGMMIGARAIGANEGYVYIRAEYPLAMKRLEIAIDQAKEYGLIGENIFDTDFSFDIHVKQGAGAFVCGEETALIASIEGRPPEPRQRPPFPAQSGLWGKPTNINNVETWATVPEIINKGAKWFASIGTELSKGTKVFSLVGKINNTGLVEVPMGITLKEIIYDIGGGIPGGKRFKAIQTGGPSGGCIPARLIDLPVDFEKLTEAGSIMGSGGLIVMDEDTCVVDVSKYFIEFTNDESCGKCASCRDGSAVLLELLKKICRGDGKEADLQALEELSNAIKDGSMCGLGQTLPNPVLSTLKYFIDEYLEHVKYKRCSALVCKGIISSACQHICPLSQDAPCYIGLIAQGKFEEAIKVVRKENPLPLICGRVCHAPCEDKCVAGEWGDPVGIRSLKRFLADYEMKHGIVTEEKPKEQREEQIAVIGSGPGGLTCAYYLALEGYKVTVFESQPKAGGMLAVGIPEFRLPKDVLDYEIDRIRKLGVEIKTKTTIGKDIPLEKLKEEYKAIFIAIGAHKGLKMKIPGEDSEGVIDAVEFLRDVNLGRDVKIGDKVIVVGGGNSAIDAARVAKRLGKDTKIFYRRTKAEMPAIKSEIEEAIFEGIDIQFLAVPTKVLSSNGRIEAVECINMELGDVDASGRRRPVPITGSEFNVEVDTLILAISQEPDVSPLTNGFGLNISKWSTIEVDPETLLTNVEGIFAGGDAVTGPNTVTEAMAHGKTAAQMIDKYIRGEKLGRKYEVTRPALHVEPVELSEEEVKSLKRPEMPSTPVAQRIENFEEVELGFTEADAITEAKRCLRCDLEKEEEEEEVIEEKVAIEEKVEEKPEEKEEVPVAVEAEPEKKEVEEEKPEEKVEEPAVAEKVEEKKAEVAIEEKVEEKPEEPAVEAAAPEPKEAPEEKEIKPAIEIPEMKEVKPAEVKKEEEKVEPAAPEPKEEPEEKKIKAAIEIPEMKEFKPAVEIPAMKKEEEEKPAEVKAEEKKEEEEKPEEKRIKAVVEIPDMKKEEEVKPTEEKVEEKEEAAKPEEEIEEKKEEGKVEAAAPEKKKIKAVIDIPEMKKKE